MTNKRNLKKRICAVAAVVAVVLFSLFVALDYDHDCTGIDCEICAFLSVCERVTENIVIIAVPLSISFLFFKSKYNSALKQDDYVFFETPVDLRTLQLD